jgi:hypothetical protein
VTQGARELERTFSRAWGLLARNWVLVVPGIVVAVLSGAVEYAFATAVVGAIVISGNGSPDAIEATQAVVTIAMLLIAVGFALVQMAYVTGMAGAAWREGTTTLRDGWYALSHRLLPLAAAAVLLFLIGLCAAVLSPVTFGVPLAVYAVFFIYTLASVIIGGRGAIDGIAESARLALANIGPTLGVVALIVVISAIAAWLGGAIGHVSAFAGWLVAGVLQQIIVAYASLVVAGEYLKLTDQSTA